MLSVIIPTYNRNNLLNECLTKLSPAFQTLDSSEYEVIVMDDSKDDKAKQLVESNHSWATWFSGPKKGPAANRNQGAKNAKGDWLVFIDDDCLPSPGLLQNYYKVIKEEKYSAIEGAILAERERQRFDEDAPINKEGGNFWSCNIAIKKNTFWNINGFDEGFPYPALEDTDLHQRIKEITQPYFASNASVVHPWRKMIPFKNYKKWLASNRYYLSKNKVKKNVAFRITRVKLMVGNLLNDMRNLKGFSYKGFGFFVEKTLFNFLMIFV